MNSVSPALVDIDEAAEDLCPTCKHPLVSHDVISARWCAATELGTGRRECICSGVLANARVFTHY
ncbi:MAG TPA: RGCVC family protein [Propionibacteriaceae bacterium]|nr:RGCVC family protein [Propionibacteriaceae bacterium]